LDSLEEKTNLPWLNKTAIALKRRSFIGWLAIYVFLAGFIQFYIISTPVDADTDYHIAVGRLIRQYGILHAFPWTPFSWLSDHYADKELLFHLLFVPLAGVNWIVASKIIGTLTGSALLLTLYAILRKEGVRLSGLWAFFPLVACDVFLWRFSLVRPHLLSISLAFIVLWAAINYRLVVLAIAAAIYPWAYVGWQLPFALTLISETAGVLSARQFRWKVVVTALAGTALGLALHPNAMNLLQFTWIQIVDVLIKNAWLGQKGFELGKEFEPFTLSQWARYLLACVLMAFSSVVLAWRNRRNDVTSLAFALATLVFFAITLKTARFAEYFIPFSVVSFALASRSISWKYLSVIVFSATVLYTCIPLSETVRGLSTPGKRVPSNFVSTRLQQLIPPGSQVFTTDWGYTGTVMLVLPERRFIVALDPTFFYMKDPKLYHLWYTLLREPPADAAERIRKDFGARFVLSFWDSRWINFYNALSSDPSVRMLLNDDYWLLLDLGEPTRPEQGAISYHW